MQKSSLLALILNVCWFLVAATATSLARQPNVVVLLADDQGWGDLSWHGNTNLATPRIDSLATDGVRCERFFVCPVCSPTRAEFLTGRYHPRMHVFATSRGGERMDLDEVTIAETFKAAGYATAAFGKWHNGMQYPYHPNGRGFDLFYGFCSGHWGNYFSPLLERNGQLTRGNGYVTDDFTEQAIEFIHKHREQPFFVYLPYNIPHSPMQVPAKFWEKFQDHPLPLRHNQSEQENVGHSRAALAMCENIDWNVGRLLDELDKLNLQDDTIVVYFSDNGPNGFRWNGGMKGIKGSTDEGGVRSPLFIRWPGKLAAGKTVSSICGAIDLLPTLADLAGVPLISKQPLDGVSLKPLLQGVASPWPDRKLFSHWDGRVSVRTDRYRLDHENRLYDMLRDPGQNTDVAEQLPNVAQELRAAVKEWRAELKPNDRTQRRPFVIGHPDYRYTQLPARDAQIVGDIQRSSRHPNCSYFTNWRSLDDQITWEVELPADGRFEVELYYTCSADDVGSTVELIFGDARLTARIEKICDPLEEGLERDLVPRSESYTKNFQALPMGTIDWKQGSGPLVLRAVEIAGSQVMDFRLLMLKRLE